MQHLLPGLDISGQDCVSIADLIQLISASKPVTNTGFVIQSDTAPDVVTTPELEAFLWVETVAGAPNGKLYYYNGSSWSLIALINPSLFADGSIALAKLSLSGGAPGYILQINALGTAIVWTSIVNAITTGSLPLTKLAPNGTTAVAMSLSGVAQWATINTFLNQLTNGSIPVNRLVPGDDTLDSFLLSQLGVQSWVPMADFVNYIQNFTIALDKLAGGSALQVPRKNVTNTGWEFYTPPTVQVPNLIQMTATQNLPAAVGTLTFTHGLGAKPRYFKAVLVCVSDEYGYVSGDEVDRWYYDTGSDNEYLTTAVANTTTVRVVFLTGPIKVNYLDGTDGVVSITRANWQAKVYSSL